MEHPLSSAGDLVLTDPGAMRALADPARLALHDRLRREGPATAAELSSHDAAVEDHLRELERFGLVERVEKERWQAIGKGVFFELAGDEEQRAAARELSKAMFSQYVDLPREWATEDEPRLELDWARAAGLVNARVTMTANELRDIQAALERLLDPFITRVPDDVAAGARPVRVLSYFMPEARRDGA
jgi:DNA-binding transcriptional ArsR family regulator